mgnify:FL=1
MTNGFTMSAGVSPQLMMALQQLALLLKLVSCLDAALESKVVVTTLIFSPNRTAKLTKEVCGDP